MQDPVRLTDAVPLTVMTWNLRVHTLLDGKNAWPKRVSSVTSVFETHQPAFVGTQEGLPKMLSDLDERLAGYQRIGRGREVGYGGEHCAIYYKTDTLELVEEGQFWLSETPDTPSGSWGTACFRICTWGEFRIKAKPDVRFRIYNTHLDHRSREARENGSTVICNRMQMDREMNNVPAILTGDMNAPPTDTVIRFLRGQQSLNGMVCHLRDVYTEINTDSRAVGRTFHGFHGGTEGHPIDYIFTTEEAEIRNVAVDRHQYLGRYPSDHYPVLATVSLPVPRGAVQ